MKRSFTPKHVTRFQQFSARLTETETRLSKRYELLAARLSQAEAVLSQLTAPKKRGLFERLFRRG